MTTEAAPADAPLIPVPDQPPFTSRIQPGRSDRRTMILLFMLIWWSIVAFGSSEWNPNNTTRLFAAISLVEDGDARIDAFADLTIDKAQFDGHTYMDKAPGITFMALPVVALMHAVSPTTSKPLVHVFESQDMGQFLKLRLRLVVASVIAPLTALAAVLLYDLGLALTGSIGGAVFGALGFGIGSPVWGWSTTLLGHAPVTALLVIAIWAIWRATHPGAKRPIALFALAGAVLGLSLVIEHPALLVGGPVGLWGIYRATRQPAQMRNRMLFAALLAGTIAVLPLLVYNLFTFGTAFQVGYQGVVGFDGMRQGLFGLTYPKPEILFKILFSTDRGMIWIAPVMILAPFGIARLIRDPATRDIGWLAVAGAVVTFLYNASYVYWHGGYSTGPRHALPALAFLSIGLAPYWASLRQNSGGPLAMTLLAAGIAINAIVASAEIFSPNLIGPSIIDIIWRDRFTAGYLRTFGSDWLGWTAWQGFFLWMTIATALLTALVVRTRALMNARH